MTSTSDLITRSKDFNPENITYGPPKMNKRGGKNIDIRYNGNPLCIQFPLQFTWGCNERVDESSGRVSYDAGLVFESKDENDPEGQLWAKFKRMQEKVLEDSVTNSKLWFGKSKMSAEVAEAMMYPILKYPKDKETGEFDYDRDPNVKLKIPFWDGVFKVELYDMDRQPLFLPKTMTEKSPVALMPMKSHIKGLMRCNGLWFSAGRFGVTWSLVQAQVRMPVRLGGGCCMLDDSDDESTLNRLQKEEAAEEVEQHVELAVNEVNDSADDDEEEPPKKKKTVKRRKKKKAAP